MGDPHNDALRAGRDPNAKKERYKPSNWGECAPMFLAAYMGAPRTTVELLAATGADVGWASRNGYTALHVAAERDRVEVIWALGGTHGADLNAQNK